MQQTLGLGFVIDARFLRSSFQKIQRREEEREKKEKEKGKGKGDFFFFKAMGVLKNLV